MSVVQKHNQGDDCGVWASLTESDGVDTSRNHAAPMHDEHQPLSAWAGGRGVMCVGKENVRETVAYVGKLLGGANPNGHLD